MLGAGAWGGSREMIWDGMWEGGSRLGTHVHPWLIHVCQCMVMPVQYCKAKVKIKKKKMIMYTCIMYTLYTLLPK